MSKRIPVIKLKENQYICDGVECKHYVDHYWNCLRNNYVLANTDTKYRQEDIIAETKYAMLLENPQTHKRQWFRKQFLALIDTRKDEKGKLHVEDWVRMTEYDRWNRFNQDHKIFDSNLDNWDDCINSDYDYEDLC